MAGIRYPKDLLQIQVLDDSPDGTTAIVARAVEHYRAQGFDISHLHRTDRTGYKAGALDAGLRSATGELVLIFDADFVSPPDVLEKTVGYFADPQVGLVQARWGHINRDYSLLTEVQSIMLAGPHFVMEHGARSRSGRFFNFNGTAGVWRRTTIEGMRMEIPGVAADLNAWASRHGLSSSGRYAQLGKGALVLWHGTSRERAEKIAEHGLFHKRGLWTARRPMISHSLQIRA